MLFITTILMIVTVALSIWAFTSNKRNRFRYVLVPSGLLSIQSFLSGITWIGVFSLGFCLISIWIFLHLRRLQIDNLGYLRDWRIKIANRKYEGDAGLLVPNWPTAPKPNGGAMVVSAKERER